MFLSRRQLFGHFTGAAIAAPPHARAIFGRLEPTPQEIVGPFYPIAKPADSDADLTLLADRKSRAAGQIIEISGRVVDLAGRPVPRAALEIWQANAAGRYAHPSDDNPAPLDPNFQGYARLATDSAGEYRIVMVKPGAYPGGRRGMRTPHVHFDLSGRFDGWWRKCTFPKNRTMPPMPC
jgi:protocatechuate 3,4-dioxygenase beta subunit